MVPKIILVPVTILVTALTAFLSACQPAAAPNSLRSGTSSASLPNPASVYCEQNGGKLELRQDASAGVAGICVFPDGSECDEWAYFRGECAPASASATASPTSVPMENAPVEPVEEQPAGGWQLYRNDDQGYRFEYPPDTLIKTGDDPLNSLTISGIEGGSEFWPQITVSHPASRDDFRPPEGTSLEEWLASHNLMPDERQPDLTIAGTTAVHIRHDRSPQSYAFDRYYFIHAGQLYEVVIGHVGDHEDWPVYNRFLESFQFID